ncbi:MAG TPA: aromatic ring-hydroxylating dioxygenase subunit alpha [Rhizomicrobium sp.]|jgi:phenylpropionate dioxygenase-like ring-hydroxylating dioxygenase large terminal subunit|nr:aromatic ring-hydroxylating dioxygenase subunit alpha [Rhizomicrobium sp.]
MVGETVAMASGADPGLFLRDLWYMPALAKSLGPGQMRREMLLGEPVALGRLKSGELFALRDICPHRGVPLSAGRVMAEGSVECPYHGWRFQRDGACSKIPSLTGHEDLKAENVRVRAYPVREQDGLIWVYMAAKPGSTPKSEPPRVGVSHAVRWTEKQNFRCGIDHAVIGLMDPAHGPYVHAHWWWKKTPRMKEKHYAPLPDGFVMTAHRPSKPVYSLLGDVTTEITFELPSTRFEIIRGRLFGADFKVVGLTVCTPRDAENTDVIQVFYWPAWLNFIYPFFWALGATFIGDDRKIVELQREGLKFNPNLMLIQDADQPAIWYHRVKKAWAESVEKGTEFVNPVQERTLRWKS